jgi:hypothetical protein
MCVFWGFSLCFVSYLFIYFAFVPCHCFINIWCVTLLFALHCCCLLWCVTLALWCCCYLLWSIIFHLALLLFVVVHHPSFCTIATCYGASPSPCNVHYCCYLLWPIIPCLVLLLFVCGLLSLTLHCCLCGALFLRLVLLLFTMVCCLHLVLLLLTMVHHPSPCAITCCGSLPSPCVAIIFCRGPSSLTLCHCCLLWCIALVLHCCYSLWFATLTLRCCFVVPSLFLVFTSPSLVLFFIFVVVPHFLFCVVACLLKWCTSPLFLPCACSRAESVRCCVILEK